MLIVNEDSDNEGNNYIVDSIQSSDISFMRIYFSEYENDLDTSNNLRQAYISAARFLEDHGIMRFDEATISK